MLMEILISYVIPVLVPVVVGVGVALLRKLSRKLDADTNASTTERVLSKSAALAATIVTAVEQAVRPGLKEALADGKLDVQEKTALKNAAMERLKEFLGPEGLREIAVFLGVKVADHTAVETFLSDHIEAAVFNLNASRVARESFSTPPPPANPHS